MRTPNAALPTGIKYNVARGFFYVEGLIREGDELKQFTKSFPTSKFGDRALAEAKKFRATGEPGIGHRRVYPSRA